MTDSTSALLGNSGSHDEGEVLFRATFEQAAVGIAHVDADGHWLRVNQKFCEIVGYPRDDLVRLRFQDITHPDDLDADLNLVRRLLAGELSSYALEKRYLRKDKTTVWVKLTVSLLGRPSGEPPYFIKVIEDISRPKEIERELAERQAELALVGELTADAASTLDLPAVLESGLRGAMTLMHVEGGTLCLLDRDRETLHLAAAVNASPGMVADLTSHVVRIGECLCGHVARTGEPLILWDNASGSQWATREATRSEGIRFHAAFPLQARGQAIGVLCVFSRADTRPAPPTIGLVQALCGPLALAIDNARLFDAERRARAQAEDVREQLHHVFERVTDAFVALDKDWRYTYVNARAGELFGRRPEDLLGKHIWTEFPEGVGQPFHRAYERAMAEQEPLRFEDYYAPYDRWFENIVYPSPDGLSIYFHDVTERKRAEMALSRLNAELEDRVRKRTVELAATVERAEAADRLKSAFLATMSHELRTPLNSILGFTGLLLQGLPGPLNDEQAKQLGMVRGSARHLLSLINDILDLSKIEAGELTVAEEAFDLRAAVERAVASVKPLADKKNLALAVQLSDEVGEAVSDRRRVEQVLLNLLTNAVKFTEKGGVTVAAEVVAEYPCMDAQDSRVSPLPQKRAAMRIRVTDTGVGIRPEDLKRLFQPFHQVDTGLARQHEGTGLGLAICRKLAGLLGGEVRAESEWGQGSTFSFFLPLKRGETS